MKKVIIDKYRIRIISELVPKANPAQYDILCKIIEHLCRLRLTADE